MKRSGDSVTMTDTIGHPRLTADGERSSVRSITGDNDRRVVGTRDSAVYGDLICVEDVTHVFGEARG